MDPLRPTSPDSADPSADPSAVQPTTPGSPWARPDGVPADGDPTTAVPAVATAPVGQPQMAPGIAVGAAGAPVAPAGSPATIAPPAKRRSSGRWLNAVLAIAACVAIGGVAFAIGRGTASASTASSGNGRGGFVTNGNGNGTGQRPFGSFAPGANGNPGFIRGGGFGGGAGLTVSGTVESVTADSITIKTANGQTITIGTGADTTYHSQAPASASDVTSGKTVQIQLGGFTGGRGNGGGNGGGNGAPQASGAPAGPIGTADSITVVP